MSDYKVIDWLAFTNDRRWGVFMKSLDVWVMEPQSSEELATAFLRALECGMSLSLVQATFRCMMGDEFRQLVTWAKAKPKAAFYPRFYVTFVLWPKGMPGAVAFVDQTLQGVYKVNPTDIGFSNPERTILVLPSLIGNEADQVKAKFKYVGAKSKIEGPL